MLNQLITMSKQKQKLQAKNSANNDGTREGLPAPQLSDSLAMQDTKKKFRKQILDKKLYSEQKPHVPELIKHKSHKNECFYPLNSGGKMHPSVEAEFLTIKKYTKDRWFEEQLADLKKEIDRYYQQHEHLYEDIKNTEEP